MHLDAPIPQPVRKAALGTLGVARPAAHTGYPSPQTHAARVDQAPHHPDEGIQVTDISPLSILTQ